MLMYEDPTAEAVIEKMEELEKKTGYRFEEKMAGLIRTFASAENEQRKKAGNKSLDVVKYDETEDMMNGTDIMLRDKSEFFGHNGTIRFDVTHHFSKKDNMPFVKSKINEPFIIEGLDGHDYEFQYGIRTGNPHRNFEEPVIVIGFDISSKEYIRFEDDLKAQRNLAENIYEIINMSNDMLQSFYYQTDNENQKKIDMTLEPDERPDINLITFNKNYLVEAGKYAGRRWELPPDTKLAQMSRELLRDLVYSPAVERLAQKYEEQNFVGDVSHIDEPKTSEL